MVLDLIRIVVAVELVTHYKLWQLTLTATSCFGCSVLFISHVDDYGDGLIICTASR